ncbi:MAG: PIN/TRAM domain-containing protein [Phycisphaerae bacterium]|nr:PIN/TRAM domain-containing protein [Phycisphaerae bacterium]
MVLTVLRVMFVLLGIYAAFFLYQVATTPHTEEETVTDSQGKSKVVVRVTPPPMAEGGARLAVFAGVALAVSLTIVFVDAGLKRKSLGAISGVFFGLLAGLAIAYALGLVVDLLANAWWSDPSRVNPFRPGILGSIKLAIGVITCYLTMSFILQTKDDFRFVIPYVEFAKQTKGVRPMLLDTSVIIDGRIADIAESKLIDSQLVVPRFVLLELQAIADSSDKLKRNRGRRGLDVLNRLQGNDKIDVAITDPQMGEAEALDVDHQLVALAKKLVAKIATNDYNLNKIAQLQGVDVINVNELAGALRPVVLPGEAITIRVIKPGEEMGQGVGYLDDGTMVVGEQCREMLGQEVALTVTSVLQTSAGRMIFGRREGTGKGRH